MMNRNLIHAFVSLALICPTTAWSQKEVMATINGSDAYTGSGYAPDLEIRSSSITRPMVTASPRIK